jgi:hypothetical protein
MESLSVKMQRTYSFAQRVYDKKQRVITVVPAGVAIAGCVLGQIDVASVEVASLAIACPYRVGPR